MDKQLPVSVWPEWKITEKIGEGSFGKVYKACRSEQGTTFYSAIKVITIPSNPGELSSVRSESPNEQSVKEYFQGLVDECIQVELRKDKPDRTIIQNLLLRKRLLNDKIVAYSIKSEKEHFSTFNRKAGLFH